MWPKKPIYWREGQTLYISIPFTWNLPGVKRLLSMKAPSWNRAVVGGPAIQLMPDFFAGLAHVTTGGDCPGVLQRVNPFATRTTTGCIRRCSFCGIGTGLIESGGLVELPDWPDLPIVCDNNLLAASDRHFDRVMDRLEKHVGVDFTQGLDARKLTQYHAERFARLKKPVIRLALDSMKYAGQWEMALGKLLRAKVAYSAIKTYALIGFDSDIHEAWCRCEFVQEYGVKAMPMWFHGLDGLKWNSVTQKQMDLGWDHEARKRIMGYYYKHRGEKP